MEVLITAGFHVPGTLLFDVSGRSGGVEFWHNGPICVNTGITWVSMVMLMVVTAAHCPASGVKV